MTETKTDAKEWKKSKGDEEDEDDSCVISARHMPARSNPYLKDGAGIVVQPKKEDKKEERLEIDEGIEEDEAAEVVLKVYPRRKTFDAQQIKAFQDILEKAPVLSGQVLQSLRSYAQISLEQLSIATKINEGHLVALESDDYSHLPAPIYIRGFIMSYLGYFGLNGKEIIEKFAKKSGNKN